MTAVRRLEPAARVVWPPLALSAFLVVTWALVDGFGDVVYKDTAVRLFLTLIVVLGLQIFSGNSGVLSFGHIAFMAIGAYMSALLTIPPEIKKFTYLSMPNWLGYWILPAKLSALEAVLAGAGAATIFALITAPPIVRLAGVEAGIGTLALLVIVYVFDVQTSAITRGTSTQIGVPKTTTFVMVLAWALIFVGVAFAFKQSRRGLRLRSSRENWRAAKSVGVRVPIERAVAWVLSGFVVGVAGALYGHYFVTFGPDDFYFNQGFNIVLVSIAMLVVGGMSSVTGAVVGCYFITVIYEAFRRWEVNGLGGVRPPSGTANFVLAAILLGTLILRPRGLTAGKEIPWPGDWSLGPLRRLGRRVGLGDSRDAVAAESAK
ncbi:MAG TPA: branched-chain amino acid ABC transporter permease [Gaiellaceae bacterium]|nr:branched-chain amino acid ABC transporter permease [Gaiellaceae bacterium]